MKKNKSAASPGEAAKTKTAAGAEKGGAVRQPDADAGAPQASGATAKAAFEGGVWDYLWLFPLLAAAIVYANLYAADYVWDDLQTILFSVKSLKTVKDTIFPDPSLNSSIYFRPVVLFSGFVEMKIGEWVSPSFTPKLMHSINVLTHVAVTGFVYLVCAQLFGAARNGRIAAVLAATWFALHPIHTESVGWISDRADLDTTLFTLAALYLSGRYLLEGKTWMAVLAGPTIMLGLMSKESAAVYAVAGPMYAWALCRVRGRGLPTRKEWLTLAIPAVVAFIVYFYLRQMVATFAPYGKPEYPVTAAKVIGVIAFYVLRSVWPWPQTPYVMLANIPGPVASAAILSVLALALLYVAMRKDLERPLYATGAVLMFAPMAPGLIYLFRPSGTIVAAERVLYLSTAGTAIILAAIASRLFERERWRKPLLGFFALVLAAYGIGCYRQSLIWRSDFIFWESIIEKPELNRDKAANMFMGLAYLNENRHEEAAKWFRHMVGPEAAGPAHLDVKGFYWLSRSLIDGAEIKLKQGRFPEAKRMADEALVILRNRFRGEADIVNLIAVATDISSRAGFLNSNAR